MLDSIIKFYNQSKIKAVETISDSRNNIFEENGFLDDSDIEIQINHIKEAIAATDKEINIRLNDKNVDKQLLANLSKRRKEMIFDFVFLASNDINNAERLLKIVDESYVIHRWLLAIIHYKKRDYITSYQFLSDYLESNDCFRGHFLLNVIAGDLFMQSKQYKKALSYYQEAVKRRPDSIDMHKKLLVVHNQLNNTFGVATEEAIIKLLAEED